jgi:hypothetical protein
MPEGGTVLLPTPVDRYQRRMLADVGERTRANVLARPGIAARFRRVARSSRWELYAAPGCRRAVARAIRSSPGRSELIGASRLAQRPRTWLRKRTSTSSVLSP